MTSRSLRRLSVIALLSRCLCADVASSQALKPVPMVATTLVNGTKLELEPIAWIVVSRSGRLAVGQRQSGKILFFTANGAPDGSFGTKGEGPGEFREFAGPGWVGDTLWVNDIVLHRTTFISPALKVLRTFRWPTSYTGKVPPGILPTGISARAPRSIGVTGDMLFMLPMRPPRGVTWTDGFALVRGRADGTVLDLLAMTSNPCAINTEVAAVHHLICGESGLAFSPDGNLFASLEDGPVQASAATQTTRVTLRDRFGKVVFTREIVRPVIRLANHVRDSLIGVFRGRHLPGQEDFGTMVARDLPKGAALQSIKSVRVGRDSTVWLELATPDGPQWQVLDAAGRDLALLRPVGKIAISSVSGTAAIGIIRDDDDIPSVVRITWR